jgi:hypothetical protein
MHNCLIDITCPGGRASALVPTCCALCTNRLEIRAAYTQSCVTRQSLKNDDVNKGKCYREAGITYLGGAVSSTRPASAVAYNRFCRPTL